MKLNTVVVAAAALTAVSVLSTDVFSQTPLRTKPPQVTANDRLQNSHQAVEEIKTAPISEDVLKQAAKQRKGNYGRMKRPPVAAGQIQEAWDKAGAEQGVVTRIECGTCVYKVRLREFMVTAIQFPSDVVIEKADLGDSSTFDVKPRTDNTLILLPKGSGRDSSMQVYAEDGRVYSFYLRAEGVNSKNVPDLLYKIVPPRLAQPSYVNFFGDGASEAQGGVSSPIPLGDLDVGESETVPENKDFVREVKFDPSRLRGWNDYKLWGDKELKPETVFRDDYFTYIKFGDRWNDVDLPTAYVVNDTVDELVNTRVQGSTFIIESTSKLITLKSGKKFMCVQYNGESS